MQTPPDKKQGFFSRKFILGTSIGAALFFVFAGIIFWGGFNTAMEATNTLEFCVSCHEMEDNVYKEYQNTVHYTNGSGVRASCSDCHVPDPWVHKVVRKIKASNEVFHKVLGSIDTPEKFDAKRLKLASNVWKEMKATDSRECRNCHDFTTMSPESQKPRARKQHLNAMTEGNTCIDCHKGIAHKPVHDQLSDEEAEMLAKPVPENAIEIPDHWQAFLDKEAEQKRLEKEEKLRQAELRKQEAAKKKQEAERLAKQKAEQAAQQAEAEAEAATVTTAVAAAATATKAAAGSSVDWAGIPDREVIIFYPGQASMEWVLNGRTHGGARPVKTGDRCFDCHEEELADMGQRIVTGEKEKLEPTLIPDKRGSIPVSVQATHDQKNLYMRFSWSAAAHTPAPFVDGGKMDPENPIKLALMLSTNDVEYAEQAGCWGTCHADLTAMPFQPEGQEVTKYLKESRTKIEVKGRRGKAQGGWDKRKDEAAIKAEFDASRYIDILRHKSGSAVTEDGWVLEDRHFSSDTDTTFVAKQEGDQWVVEVKRPLSSGKAGDLALALDQTYNFGFAIHDDYTNGRYHHVSIGYRLGFDNADVEINAVGM